MNIRHFKPVSIIVPYMFVLLTSCYPKSDVQDLYNRQAALEAREEALQANIDNLSKELEASLSQINQNVVKLESNQQKLTLDLQSMKMDTAIAEREMEREESRKNAKGPKADHDKSKPPVNTPEFLYSRAAASYEDGQYEDAILEYQKLIDTYPRDKRVPEAYLKQGLSLINLGRKQEAKYFLNALIDKYPNSKEAQVARNKLNSI
jgi:TolA-binding protein